MQYQIKLDTTHRTTRYYCVLRNPYVDYYDTKVIYGGTEEIVKRKIEKQLKKSNGGKVDQCKR